ncbi:MAG: FAD-dependent oxidoreductase [Pseudomonadota bacterium]
MSVEHTAESAAARTPSQAPSQARVVVIGGGIVGVSALYHLAKAGWSDAILLEKNELTAGSTWHAAGNVPNFSVSSSIMNIQRYGAALYRELAADPEYPINYHVTGSIRLAHSVERMREFEHVRSLAAGQGLTFEMMSPADVKAAYPFIETHDLEGALWDPLDGDIDPAQPTQALAARARALGATVLRHQPATGLRREGDDWVVETAAGSIRCEVIVNAAGYYARQVGAWLAPYGGRIPPMVTLQHQYLLTEEIPALEAWSAEQGRKLPLLRDVDSSYYLRQEKHGLNLGPYERGGETAWTDLASGAPEDFSFQLFPDNLERIEWYIEDAMARMPLLGEAGVSRVINGPIPYAPDGNPLIGPVPGVRNAFEACGFTFGIAQGGGAGKALAEWVTEGETEWDLWSCDPRRFLDHADQAFCDATGAQVYRHEYAMHFPMHAWPAGRPARQGPNDEAVRAAGGVMEAYGGWERALWFAGAGDDASEAATQCWDREGPWLKRIRAEAEAVRDGAGLLDLPGFSRFTLEGPGAAAWLLGRSVSGLPKIGRVSLAYFADTRGRLLTEMSVLRRGEDAFTLITAAAARRHDFDLLAAALPASGSLSLRDETDRLTTLVVTGPEARALLAPLAEADLALPWLSHQSAIVAGRRAMLARVSFAGELGWEVHCAMEDAPAIYAALRAAGAAPFGMAALDSLRIEKGYRSWKGDLSSDFTVLECGLDRFVQLGKEQDFPGKAAMAAEAERGPAQRFVALLLEDTPRDAPYMAPIFAGAERVGFVTSCAYGWRVGGVVALGMARTGVAPPGTRLEVEIFGERIGAVAQPDGPLWDPSNARLRA